MTKSTFCPYMRKSFSFLRLIPQIFFLWSMFTGYWVHGQNPNYPNQITVRVMAIREKTFEESIPMMIHIKPVYQVDVAARVGGPLAHIWVQEGDIVQAHETPLFQVESDRYTIALQVATQNVKIAELAVREREAFLKTLKIQHAQAEADFKRIDDLYQRQAISKQQWEQSQTALQQLTANLQHIEVTIELAKGQFAQAKEQYQLAKKDYEDCIVKSPINGIVTKRFVDPGAMVSPGTPVVQLISHQLLEFRGYVPQEYYEKIIQSQSKLILEIGPTKLELPIDRIAPEIDRTLRNFYVKASIPQEIINRYDLRAGMEFPSKLVLAERRGLAIPHRSIIRRDQKRIIFVIENGRAKRYEITTGLEDDYYVELISPKLPLHSEVVTMGQQFLVDQSPIRIEKKEEE